MITYEDLQRANEAIVPMAIERKDKRTGKTISKAYAEVHQRIKAFRMLYPEGMISTDMVSDDGKVCVFRAVIYNDAGHVLATGTAFEEKDASMINRTSYIENCESSAIGRALGFCGIGIDTGIASKEEVENAWKKQEAQEKQKDDEIRRKVDALELVYEGDGDKPLTDVQYATLMTLIERKGIPVDYLLKCFPKVTSIEDFTQTIGCLAVSKIDDILAGYNNSKRGGKA